MKPYPEYKPSGVPNDLLVMSAVAELRHFASDPDIQELERRRKLWRLEYYSGLEAAKEEGEAIGMDKRNIEIARSMKQDGMTPAIITKHTGLSLVEIERLG